MKNIRYVQAISLLLCVLLCLSCRVSSKEQSFSSQLDTVDALISTGDRTSAIKLLNKVSKKAFNALQRLGIYRRYLQLDLHKEAEACLEKALKKLPENLELRAAYTWFLYTNDRIDEAFVHAKMLEGSKYASILSELKLKMAKDSEYIDFLAEHLAPVYADAFISSKDEVWLRNAAIVSAIRGKYSDAFSYIPSKILEESYFWACIAYDAKRYNTVCSILENQTQFLVEMGNLQNNEKVEDLKKERCLLLADSFSILNEQNLAQKVRDDLINNYNDLTSLVYFNSAKYAKQQGNTKEQLDLLKIILKQNPEYIPAIDMYLDFAVESLKIPFEDSLSQAVRATGMKSSDMLVYDSQPKVSINEVEIFMNNLLENNFSPEIALMFYLFKINNDVSENLLPEEKIANLWLLIEKSSMNGMLPSKLVEMVIPILISFNQEIEAQKLFDRFLRQEFKTDNYSEVFPLLSPKMCEYLAFFSAQDGVKKQDAALAFHIYKILVDSNQEVFSNLASLSFYEPKISVYVNLAELYAGSKQFQKALDLYSIAIGNITDSKKRSDVIYRMANMYYMLGNKKTAITTLDYCLSSNPYHAKARILKNQLEKDN